MRKDNGSDDEDANILIKLNILYNDDIARVEKNSPSSDDDSNLNLVSIIVGTMMPFTQSDEGELLLSPSYMRVHM